MIHLENLLPEIRKIQRRKDQRSRERISGRRQLVIDEETRIAQATGLIATRDASGVSCRKHVQTGSGCRGWRVSPQTNVDRENSCCAC